MMIYFISFCCSAVRWTAAHWPDLQLQSCGSQDPTRSNAGLLPALSGCIHITGEAEGSEVDESVISQSMNQSDPRWDRGKWSGWTITQSINQSISHIPDEAEGSEVDESLISQSINHTPGEKEGSEVDESLLSQSNYQSVTSQVRWREMKWMNH